MPVSPRLTETHRLRTLLFGPSKDPNDPTVLHKMSLVAFLAWVGLGSDGLSSSAYGPDESFRVLYAQGGHGYLLVLLALATAVTVTIISLAYARVIAQFPTGGGGYVVATKLLGQHAGLVAGSALLVDYVLTITVSVASGCDALFSMLPLAWHGLKVPVAVAALSALTLLNLRGVKESVTALVPIFLTFVATHVILIVGGILIHVPELKDVATEIHRGLGSDVSKVGLTGVFLLFLNAYSRGSGTYTGIEAVSNGLQIMREPRVHTAQRTMLYMGTSLAFTAGGILLCYLLFSVRPVEGQTMNSVLINAFAGHWSLFGLPVGKGFVILSLVSEGALLLVAAQTGFIDGPRVMANMAIDSWLPRRFASLSDRLTTKDGIVLIGGAAVLLLVLSHGDVGFLVVMYAINVFVTFSLTTAGMLRRAVGQYGEAGYRVSDVLIQLAAFTLCLAILSVTVFEKLSEGAWMTLVVTAAVIATCFAVRLHYRAIDRRAKNLEIPEGWVASHRTAGGMPVQGATSAILMVGRYGPLGLHSLLSVQRFFPDYFKNIFFVSVGVVDSGAFKGPEELDNLSAGIRKDLETYVAFARRQGWNADFRMTTHVDAVEALTRMCLDLAKVHPQAHVFAGKLLWKRESWYQRILHNNTAFQVERRLQWKGLPVTILPVRLFET
ncbi:MAG: APC family permease [Deltaproteobacteria bacterium]|nr:APC family permease [Deltaproteobacteria bacterium]